MSTPESVRSPGEGNGKPLQYPCLENSMDKGAWWATVHGVAKSQIQRSDQYTTHYVYITITTYRSCHTALLPSVYLNFPPNEIYLLSMS